MSLPNTTILISFHQISFFFFFNDTATTEIYTLSLHDALPISNPHDPQGNPHHSLEVTVHAEGESSPTPDVYPIPLLDRKSTRLNSSHSQISYAVFCLKKKKKLDRTMSHDTPTILVDR